MVLISPTSWGATLLLAYHVGEEGFPFDFSHHQIPYSANPRPNPFANGWGDLSKYTGLEVTGPL